MTPMLTLMRMRIHRWWPTGPLTPLLLPLLLLQLLPQLPLLLPLGKHQLKKQHRLKGQHQREQKGKGKG